MNAPPPNAGQRHNLPHCPSPFINTRRGRDGNGAAAAAVLTESDTPRRHAHHQPTAPTTLTRGVFHRVGTLASAHPHRRLRPLVAVVGAAPTADARGVGLEPLVLLTAG